MFVAKYWLPLPTMFGQGNTTLPVGQSMLKPSTFVPQSGTTRLAEGGVEPNVSKPRPVSIFSSPRRSVPSTDHKEEAQTVSGTPDHDGDESLSDSDDSSSYDSTGTEAKRRQYLREKKKKAKRRERRILNASKTLGDSSPGDGKATSEIGSIRSKQVYIMNDDASTGTNHLRTKSRVYINKRKEIPITMEWDDKASTYEKTIDKIQAYANQQQLGYLFSDEIKKHYLRHGTTGLEPLLPSDITIEQFSYDVRVIHGYLFQVFGMGSTSDRIIFVWFGRQCLGDRIGYSCIFV